MQAVLATKLHIPLSRTQPIQRKRLFARLNEGFTGRLTVCDSSSRFR